MVQKFYTLFQKSYLFLCLLCSLQFFFQGGFTMAQGTRDTINVDFGNATRLSPAGWNNVTDSQEGAVADLVNYQGNSTGIRVAVTDAFNTGSNTAGAAADDTLRLPFNAASDSFFGSKRPAVGGGETTGGVTFSNLNLQTAYSFAIFASRPANDNRETQYTVTGQTTQVVNLVPSDPKAFFVRVMNMLPANDGTITVTATTGSNNDNPDGYYYLGAIRVTYTSTTLSTPLEKLSYYKIYPNPTSGQINISPREGGMIQKVTIFSTTGKKVLEKECNESATQRIDVSGLGLGMYLLRIQTAKGDYVSRIMLQ